MSVSRTNKDAHLKVIFLFFYDDAQGHVLSLLLIKLNCTDYHGKKKNKKRKIFFVGRFFFENSTWLPPNNAITIKMATTTIIIAITRLFAHLINNFADLTKCLNGFNE